VKKLLLSGLVILVLAYIFFYGGKDDDEYFINYFHEMVKAGEEKNLDKFMDNFSLHYQDENGLNYIVVKNIVKNVFEKYEKTEGIVSELSSSISKNEDGRETAVVYMNVIATASNGSIETVILGHNETPENITVYLEKSILGTWQIVRVEGIERAVY